MDITAIDLSRLRNSEYQQYLMNYLHFYEVNDPVAIGVEDEVQALKDAVAALGLLFKQDRTAALTAVIADLDVQRGRCLIGIATVIKGYLQHYDESYVKIARRLNHRIAIYGGTASAINLRALQGQTAILKSLTDDFQNDPVFVADVAALGLTDWVDKLKTTNSSLNNAYVERADKEGDRPAEKIKDLRKESNRLYYALRDMMRSRAHVAGYASPYNELITDTNALTEMYQQALSQRNASKQEASSSYIP